MTPNAAYDKTTLAGLLRLLPPPPEPWVAAARELPRTAGGLEQILALAETDAEFRRALIDDLEEVLRGAGFEPEPELVRDQREGLPREGGR
jgi:hypothetical protein